MNDISKLYERGLEVFEDKDNFNDWLHSEIIALGNKKPIDLINTPEGIQLVFKILGRIEHGIPSPIPPDTDINLEEDIEEAQKDEDYYSEEDYEEIFRLNDLQNQQKRRDETDWMDELDPNRKSFWDDSPGNPVK